MTASAPPTSDPEGATFAHECLGEARIELALAELPNAAKQVVELVRVAGNAAKR